MAAFASGAAPKAPSSRPRRIVSIGSCLDVVLMEVADRGQIAALSHFSRDPDTSTVADRARTYPFTYESAEEVVALRPDLVLASKRSGLQTRAALKRHGLRVEEFEVPDHVAASLSQVRKIAQVVGAPARGEACVQRIEAALVAAAPKPGQPRPTALIYQPNGFAAGDKTLVGEMLERCGFENIASRYGLKKWGNIPLERVLADPPEVLLAGERSPGAPNWAERILRHPALESLEPRTFRAAFNQRLLYCGGPVLIETAGALSRAREGALAWADGRRRSA
jgi:iron complex transport system substrate-binding protein